MNFLAHAYLSFGNPDILVGNMIADMVKGKQIELYPETIQHGIHIHRQIDAFTDSHPVTQEAMGVFRSSAGKYAGAFLDVAYDYFLARDKKNEPVEGWKAFAATSYKQISEYRKVLPDKFCSMFMYMESENWFYSYRYKWMIKRSFDRLQQRASFLDDNAHVYTSFEEHLKEIRDSYNIFFPELKVYVQSLSAEV